jgi:alpha-tubulin suppressor-like RCC1 family protein
MFMFNPKTLANQIVLFSLICFSFFSVQAQFTRAGRKTSNAYRTHYQRMSAGSDHTLEIRSGQLWAYGFNSAGQVGDNTTVNKLSPVRIGAQEDWVIVSAGRVHSTGIRANGTLWAWGNNQFGALGDGTTTNRLVPTQIGSGTNWVSVSTGGTFTMGLKADGSLWTWGRNTVGQLGSGDFNDSYIPQRVGIANDWIGISAGHSHGFALKTDGTVWAFGGNSYGELGTATPAQSEVPVQVPIQHVIRISSGVNHGMALKSDGTIWTWGRFEYGALGTGPFPSSILPTQVGNQNDWAWINAGGFQSAALKVNGTAWIWGRNNLGQQGNGNTTDVFAPAQLGTANNWVGISLGTNHTTASQANGMLFAWGRNHAGQLGQGNTTQQSLPVPVAKVLNWVAISTASSGNQNYNALRSDGTIWRITSSGHFALGADTNWVCVSGNLALKSNATLWEYASGNWIQVGVDTDWKEIYSSSDTHHAIKSDGSLWGWGYNYWREVGDGTQTDRVAPVLINSSQDWNKVTGQFLGRAGSVLPSSTYPGGAILNWGSGSISGNSIPSVLGSSIYGLVDFGIGYNHLIQLYVNGTAAVAGSSNRNLYGQLGSGINSDTLNPYIQVHAGHANCVTLKSNGSIWYWGGGMLGGHYSAQAVSVPTRYGTDNDNILMDLRNTSIIALKAHRRLIGIGGFGLTWVAPLMRNTIIGSNFACEGTSLILNADTNQNATYLWQGPNGFTSNTNPLIRPNVDQSMGGIYTLTISLYEHTFTDTHVVNISPAPLLGIAVSDSTVFCSGDSTTLSGFGAATYAWSTGQMSQSIRVLQSGTYTVVGTTTQGCMDSVTQVITVLPLPIVSISPSGNQSICEGDTLFIQASGAQTYLWNTNQTQSSLSVFLGGSYRVTGTDANGCAAQSSPVNLTMNPRPPMPYISGAQTLNIGQSTVLTASPSGILSWRWWDAAIGGNQIGSGATYTVNNFSQSLTIYAQSGYHYNCPSERQSFTINPPQSIWASSPTCVGNAIYLRVVKPIPLGSTLWTGPNGFSSTLREPSLPNATTNRTGWYKLRVDSAQIRVLEDSVFIQVNPSLAQLQASVNSPVCSGQNIVLSAESIPGARYIWTGPSSFTSRQPVAGIGNAGLGNAGVYVLNVEIPGCPAGQRQLSVTVNPISPPNPGSNSPVCSGNSILLTASAGNFRGVTYLWQGPNGFSSNLLNPTISNASPSRNGIYTLTLTPVGCHPFVQTHTVFVHNAYTSAVVSNSPVCIGDTIRITTNYPPSAQYIWTGPNGYTSASPALVIPNVTTAQRGTYQLTMSLQNCATIQRSFTVVVNEPPAPDMGSNSPICQGAALYLTSVPVTGASYQWAGPNGFISSLPNPSISNTQPNQSGIYTLTASIVGCPGSNSYTVPVTVGGGIGNIVARAIQNPVCAGASLQLTGTSIAGASMTWSGPNGFSVNSNIATRTGMTVPNAGAYSYSVVSPGCGSTTRTVLVTVNSTGVTANLIHNPICNLNPAYFTATAPAGSTYTWTGPGGFQSTQQNPSIVKATPMNAGVYTLRVIVPGCDLVQTTTTLTVNNCREGRDVEEEENLVSEPIAEVSGDFKLSLFPNPTHGKVLAELSGFAGEEMPELSIVDILGKKIQIPMKKEFLNGTYQWNLDFSGNAKGIYLLHWQGSGFDHIERVLVN